MQAKVLEFIFGGGKGISGMIIESSKIAGNL